MPCASNPHSPFYYFHNMPMNRPTEPTAEPTKRTTYGGFAVGTDDPDTFVLIPVEKDSIPEKEHRFFFVNLKDKTSTFPKSTSKYICEVYDPKKETKRKKLIYVKDVADAIRNLVEKKKNDKDAIKMIRVEYVTESALPQKYTAYLSIKQSQAPLLKSIRFLSNSRHDEFTILQNLGFKGRGCFNDDVELESFEIPDTLAAFEKSIEFVTQKQYEARKEEIELKYQTCLSSVLEKYNINFDTSTIEIDFQIGLRHLRDIDIQKITITHDNLVKSGKRGIRSLKQAEQIFTEIVVPNNRKRSRLEDDDAAKESDNHKKARQESIMAIAADLLDPCFEHLVAAGIPFLWVLMSCVPIGIGLPEIAPPPTSNPSNVDPMFVSTLHELITRPQVRAFLDTVCDDNPAYIESVETLREAFEKACVENDTETLLKIQIHEMAGFRRMSGVFDMKRHIERHIASHHHDDNDDDGGSDDDNDDDSA